MNQFEQFPSEDSKVVEGTPLDKFRTEIEFKKNDPKNVTAHFRDLHNTEHLTIDDMKMKDEFERLMNAPHGILVPEDYDKLCHDFRLYVENLTRQEKNLTPEEYESRRSFSAYLSNILGSVLLKIIREKK